MPSFSPKTYTFFCGCFAALGSILFGYDLGVMAAVLPAPNFLEITGLATPEGETISATTNNYLGFMVSALTLGAFFGCIPASLIADKFSRRMAIFVGAIVFLIGGSIQTAAQNKEMMIAGRFVCGLSIGMLSLLAPLYQSEIAHPSIRGRLTTLQQLFLGIGAFIAGWIGYGTTQGALGTALQWRLPLGIQMLPAIPLVFMIFLFPESPRWLMIRGREEESLQTLARLHARGDTSDAFVLAEWAEMREAVYEEAKLESAWRQIFFDATNRRKIMLGVILQFSVQMTGVSVLQYYSVRVFEAVDFSAATTLLLQSLNSVWALLAQAACVAFIDRLGRRWPMIIANIIIGITFLIATITQEKFAVGEGTKSLGYLFVAMTWIFNIAFSFGVGPLSWAYPVEIMNTSIRAKGTAITSMSCWISNFMIGQVSPIALTAIGWKYYIVFAVCGFTNALTIWALFPETKGRSLESMTELFENTPWFVGNARYDVVDGKEVEEEMRARAADGGLDGIDLPHTGERSTAHDNASKANEQFIEKA